MKAFAQVAQTGSFAEAARRLGLATSVVSKRVKDLEAFLSTQLLQRTTRKVSLTDTGYSYLEYVRKFLDELEEVEEGIRNKTQKPIGEIKLAAPLSFGIKYLGPALSKYLQEYENVSIKTFLSDRQIDLVEEGYDLSIRIGQLKDSSLISRKLANCRRVVCASPAYFEKHGRPQKPKDLMGRNCMSYTNLAEGKAWPFIVEGKNIWQSTSGRFFSDNGDLLCEAAIAECGITLLPTFIVGKPIRSGELEIILEKYEEPDFNIYAIYQNRRHLSTKVRTLIDYLTAYFKDGL
ncbi:Transcriptional regulator, LysR family [hydrothermal vent metagenome]|uniref:Transcriptional regulator, LysR family n=1 Tax=hydrothermal vent metagenome TaxID=652676 RepID=A0A3B0RHR6_9ZZZZ